MLPTMKGGMVMEKNTVETKTAEKNITEVVFILDRSGSMGGLEADTIGGYNSMLARQKEEEVLRQRLHGASGCHRRINTSYQPGAESTARRAASR